MAFMNRINNAQNPLGALVNQLGPQASPVPGGAGRAAPPDAPFVSNRPGIAPPDALPQPIGGGAADAGAAGVGGYKLPQPVPYGPTPVGSSLKMGQSPVGIAGAAPDPSKGLAEWIKYYGAQAGADPSVANDPSYWNRVISENMAKNGGNLDQDYWSYRMTSDPNKGTGYYADRNSGKTPYDGGMPGGGAALSGLLGGMTGLPQGLDAQAIGGQDITANANSQLQALLAQLMGGR